MAIKLSNATLDQLPEGVLRPSYDRSALTAGIVHIGLGNFHRAHQSWYLHRLMQQGLAHDWAIVGAGVRPYDADDAREDGGAGLPHHADRARSRRAARPRWWAR